jgi:HlyD family secretion protein
MSTIVETSPNRPSRPPRSLLRRVTQIVQVKWLVVPLVLIGIAVYGWQNRWWGNHSGISAANLVTYQVAPRDLPITIIERGRLESQTNLQVFCEVDDYRSDGINGTTIIWIIPNGSSVSKGDLICELDSSAIQAELDEQILDTEEAKSAYIQAQANLKNQAIDNQTSYEKAELDLRLAELELEMFKDPKTGSHKLALEAIERLIEDLNNEILAAEMNLKLARNDNTGIESLFKLGYAGKSELDRSVLSLLKAEGDYAAKLNKLNTQMASFQKLNSFERQMQELQLQGKMRTCAQNLKQVELTNAAKMSQMEGILSSRTEQLAKEEERLKRFKTQYANCKIYAPQDGMVAYAPSSSSRDPEIAEGTAVRLRQHIFSIPNLRRMQVETSIHESALDRIQPGLKVNVTVDAFADRSYTGTVKSVAVLPERSYYSDAQKYKTVITIDEDVYQIKPGMTAVSEVKVDYLPNVNAVPIQAIVQRSGQNWLYVKQQDKVERRKVALGLSNDQYVIVTDGVDVGELVVLNPNGLLDESKDGEVIDDNANVQPTETLVAAKDDSANAIN